MIYTLTSVLASPNSEAPAKCTRMPRAYCVSVAPAAAPVGDGARPVAAGGFPLWLVQTDASGIERCRMLVTSPAPIYLGKGTGTQWFLVAGASVAVGSDAAYDVTIGDDPADWLEQVPTGANGATVAAGQVSQVQTFTTGQGVDATFTMPQGAFRTLSLLAYLRGAPFYNVNGYVGIITQYGGEPSLASRTDGTHGFQVGANYPATLLGGGAFGLNLYGGVSGTNSKDTQVLIAQFGPGMTAAGNEATAVTFRWATMPNALRVLVMNTVSTMALQPVVQGSIALAAVWGV